MRPSVLLLLSVLSLLAAGRLHAGTRVALVIGNNKYANLSEGQQLTSPLNDAKDLATTLQGMGYTLVTGGAVLDSGRDAIISATEEFAVKAKGADAAVFYFSGHGIQVGEDNFLMPSDTPRITSYTVLKNRGVHLREAVMVALEEAQARTKVIILDCCRDNPFASQVEQALGQIGKSMRTKGGLGEITGYGPGFFLAFATSPGTVANDGNGRRNSPFTAAMLTQLRSDAGEDISAVFRNVKAEVRQSSGAEQVPWTSDSLDEAFAFGMPGGASGIMVPVPPVSRPTFTKLFNGKTLYGWRGGSTFDHRQLLEMPASERREKIATWTANMVVPNELTGRPHWYVENGELVNDGLGDYATTEKDYGDFELYLEYKTVPKCDSGIYLRGVPQVQIWDTTENDDKSVMLGKPKGSGGLWNNSAGTPGKDPLVQADRPFGEWNKVHILMAGVRVSVWLNDRLVVDHAVMENYFDKRLPPAQQRPIPPRGPIQLQTHGGEIRWRNIYVREIGPEEAGRILSSAQSRKRSTLVP